MLDAPCQLERWIHVEGMPPLDVALRKVVTKIAESAFGQERTDTESVVQAVGYLLREKIARHRRVLETATRLEPYLVRRTEFVIEPAIPTSVVDREAVVGEAAHAIGDAALYFGAVAECEQAQLVRRLQPEPDHQVVLVGAHAPVGVGGVDARIAVGLVERCEIREWDGRNAVAVHRPGYTRLRYVVAGQVDFHGSVVSGHGHDRAEPVRSAEHARIGEKAPEQLRILVVGAGK